MLAQNIFRSNDKYFFSKKSSISLYSFNGKEKDDEWNVTTGGALDFGARIYDARLCGFLSIDHSFAKYPNFSPYSSFNDNPLYFKDPTGESGEASIYLVKTKEDADKYGVPINTSIVLVKSNYIFYGDITLATANTVAKDMQDAWNNVDGKGYGSTVVDGKSYNVVFEVSAEVRNKKENESENDFFSRLTTEFFGSQTEESQSTFNPSVLAADIKNNFIAVYNLGTKSSKTRTCNSGLWNSNEILTKTVLNESYHGFTGMPDQEYVPGKPRAANARGSGVNADNRLVTQQDINDIGLGTLLGGGKSSAEVGYQSNTLYNPNIPQEQKFNDLAVKQKAQQYEKKLQRNK
jgi:RHS repeat-associated protein